MFRISSHYHLKKKTMQEIITIEVQKKEDCADFSSIYTKVYSKQYASIEIKTYDPQQNKLNDFNLNYGHSRQISTSM